MADRKKRPSEQPPTAAPEIAKGLAGVGGINTILGLTIYGKTALIVGIVLLAAALAVWAFDSAHNKV